MSDREINIGKIMDEIGIPFLGVSHTNTATRRSLSL
jgi:hypothetical protein